MTPDSSLSSHTLQSEQPVEARSLARAIPAHRRKQKDHTGAPETLPLWFERGLVVVVAGILCCGGFGLLLAFLGDYHIAPVLLVGGAATIATSLIAWPRRRLGTQTARSALAPALGMLGLAIGFAVWNGHYAGHQVSIGRDPGVYADAGKWIATHGNLEVRTGPDWSSKGPNLSVLTPGMYSEGGNRLEFQFDHLTPVLLAEADNVGGDRLMFKVPALLGALGLCAVYAVGCRLIRRPWLALAAVTSLALSLPQINIARATYSEPSVQLLVWAGIWLLLAAYERRRLGIALLAGAALAGTILSRIDAPVYLIPLPALGAIVWLAANPGKDRRFLAQMYATIVCVAAPIAALGALDVGDRAGQYYADLSGQVHQLKLGLGASFIAGAALILLWPLVAPKAIRLTSWVRASQGKVGTAAASLAGLALVGAWLVRPAIMHVRLVNTPAVYAFVGGLQRAAGYANDPSRTYAERSMVWISWYLGPITVGLAIIGAAILVDRLCRRPDPAAVLVVTIAGIGTVAYLWNPSIVPDQIWAMRRFVPVGLPLLVLLAAVALGQLAAVRLTARLASVGARLAVIAGVAGMIAIPLRVMLPVRDFQPQTGYINVLDATCHVTGPHAALLVVPGQQLDQVFPPALRSWCNVPVALSTGTLSASQLQHLASAWQVEGRTLWVLAATPAMMAKSVPGLKPALVGAVSDSNELEVRLDGPPRHLSPIPLSVYAAKAP